MLFHVSEEPGIERFEPRPSPYADGPVVWAIDAERLRNYLLPRDCPRVTYYASPGTAAADVERFLGSSPSVIAVESAWLERLRSCRLYCYHLPPRTFECLDECAGYFISRRPVVPAQVQVVAVGPPDTGNKHAYVGQTWDWMQSVAGKSRVTEWRRAGGVSVLAYGFPGMPMGAGMNAEGIALCWTSADLGKKGQAPRVGIPSYMLIAHLLAQKDLDGVVREARKNKHAGWFTFVLADGHGWLVNLEGSPERVVVEEADGRLARVLYGSRAMAGGKLHARCQTMYDLLRESQGKNDLSRLQDYFADPKYKINTGKGTIDMMVFDTTARTAYLSRGSSYQLSWREFVFGAK